VVPGFNADEDQMSAIGRLIASLPRVLPVELLPYHRLGEGKYVSLGLVAPEAPGVPAKELLERLAKSIEQFGAPCAVGG
jgi:pyruvate formate lyase activating enzyme